MTCDQSIQRLVTCDFIVESESQCETDHISINSIDLEQRYAEQYLGVLLRKEQNQFLKPQKLSHKKFSANQYRVADAEFIDEALF
ncbi:hypothetical protein L21SP5_01853 [Salinivirga cyanobacteriivorans]|uniref:Uncharacterized protein n=2 Tax=Salinivirga cyanobacteriivorans TaxID=1307839 RepID=A0A0S2I012_9BACT|nr:hypothetical protein L21SP5_01853 [Salinivirga cyanobacteriivorans]